MNGDKLPNIIQIANVYHLLTIKEGVVMMKLTLSVLNRSNGIIIGRAVSCKSK